MDAPMAYAAPEAAQTPEVRAGNESGSVPQRRQARHDYWGLDREGGHKRVEPWARRRGERAVKEKVGC